MSFHKTAPSNLGVLLEIAGDDEAFADIVNAEVRDLTAEQLTARLAIDERLMFDHDGDDHVQLREPFVERLQRTLNEIDRRKAGV